MKRWLKMMRPVNGRQRVTKPLARRLGAQQLESRQLMAADIGLIDTTLAIQGSPMNDVGEVYIESGRVVVTVSTYDDAGQVVSETSDEFAAEAIDRIVFEGFAGDDVLVNDTAIDTVARGGGGNDTLMGGSGTNLLIGGVGDDLFLAGGGTIMAIAGPGNDTTIDQLAADVGQESGDEAEASKSEDLGEENVTDDQSGATCLVDSEDTSIDASEDTADELQPPLNETVAEENLQTPPALTQTESTEMNVPTTGSPESAIGAEATEETQDVELQDAPQESDQVTESETDDDVIFGGSGDDWLFGGGGQDMIFGNTSPLDDELLRSVISGRLRL